ncbi:hypothetical protein J6590_042863 [Homalodisca vitripennis]|nr:hypothetical protein J6590_042863 [Homalodisca vitripennis]
MLVWNFPYPRAITIVKSSIHVYDCEKKVQAIKRYRPEAVLLSLPPKISLCHVTGKHKAYLVCVVLYHSPRRTDTSSGDATAYLPSPHSIIVSYYRPLVAELSVMFSQYTTVLLPVEVLKTVPQGHRQAHIQYSRRGLQDYGLHLTINYFLQRLGTCMRIFVRLTQPLRSHPRPPHPS